MEFNPPPLDTMDKFLLGSTVGAITAMTSTTLAYEWSITYALLLYLGIMGAIIIIYLYYAIRNENA